MTTTEIIRLTEHLISYRSVLGNDEELRTCVEAIERYFVESNVSIRHFERNNVKSLYISLHDTFTPHILFNAHFDVVGASRELFHARRQSDKIIGRGALDDKGPLAIVMVLLFELAQLNPRPNIGLLVTGDEEIGGHNGVKYVLSQGLRPSFSIILDGGTLNEYVVKQKGILFLKLIATGVAAHGSRPWTGENAVDKLITAYNGMKKVFPHERDDRWEKSMNLSTLNGGITPNAVPHAAEMNLDIRYTEVDDPDEIIEEINEIAQAVGNIEVHTEMHEPNFNTSEQIGMLQKLLHISSAVVQLPPRISSDHGGSDARFFSAQNLPCVVTWPAGGDVHGSQEYIDITKIDTFYTIMKRFCEENG